MGQLSWESSRSGRSWSCTFVNNSTHTKKGVTALTKDESTKACNLLNLEVKGNNTDRIERLKTYFSSNNGSQYWIGTPMASDVLPVTNYRHDPLTEIDIGLMRMAIVDMHTRHNQDEESDSYETSWKRDRRLENERRHAERHGDEANLYPVIYTDSDNEYSKELLHDIDAGNGDLSDGGASYDSDY